MYLQEPLEKKELMKLFREEFDCNSKTIERRLKELIDVGTVLTDEKGSHFTLDKHFKDRKITYYLKPSNNNTFS